MPIPHKCGEGFLEASKDRLSGICPMALEAGPCFSEGQTEEEVFLV